METTPTCINGFQAHKLDDPGDVVAHIKDLVQTLSPNGRFPGPNPCSLERADLKTVQRGNNWLCEKTDGTRTILAFLLHNGLRVSALVTRSWDVYVIGVRKCPKVLFQGTVFDGELVFTKGTWFWLGFDAVVVAGIPVWTLPLSERLAAATRSLKDYEPHPGDPLHLCFKSYFRNFDEYEAPLRTSPFPADGTIITPEESPVVLGRHVTLFKIKDNDKHTVDFEFKKPNKLRVYDPAKKKSVDVGTLIDVPADATSGVIVEASFSGNTQWTLVTIRQDKTTSNDMLTYTKTMVNIRENLKLDDVKPHWAV